MMKCSCGGKIERINRKKMRCIKCGAEFSVLSSTGWWNEWKQNVKVVEKLEIVRNGLVNIFVILVTVID